MGRGAGVTPTPYLSRLIISHSDLFRYVLHIVYNIITVKLFSSSRLGCNIGDKKSLWAKKVRLSILSIGIGQSTWITLILKIKHNKVLDFLILHIWASTLAVAYLNLFYLSLTSNASIFQWQSLQVDTHKEKQSLNPFSDSFDADKLRKMLTNKVHIITYLQQ